MAPPDGATCIDIKFGYPAVVLASLDGATSISYKFGHQMAPLAIVNIELVSLSARVTSVKFQQGVLLSFREPDT